MENITKTGLSPKREIPEAADGERWNTPDWNPLLMTEQKRKQESH